MPEQASDPKIDLIPEQLLPAGKEVNLDLSLFVNTTSEKEDNLRYEMENGPSELSMDPKTGIITGTTKNNELNQTYVVTFIVTNEESGEKFSETFNLEVIGSLLLETPEGQAFFAKQEVNFWEASESVEIQLFVQHLLVEHFAWVMIYDESKEKQNLGKLIEKYEAKSGWTILDFENAVMVMPGDKAFELYGNRSRILDTLREALIQKVDEKNWERIAIEGSDMESIGKCWVIAQELNLPVDAMAPTDIAEVNYYNIKRVFSDNTPSLKYRAKPGG